MAAYVELEDLKRSLELAGESYADEDLTLAISAASSAIEAQTNRTFAIEAEDATREYVTSRRASLELGDMAAVSGVAVDRFGDGTWVSLVEGEDFDLLPYNHSDDDQPIQSIQLRQGGQIPSFEPYHYYGLSDVQTERWPTVRVTGRFGWNTVPDPIVAATKILATRLLKRVREAPFGVAGMGADGIAVRIANGDPDVAMLVGPYTRRRLLS
jgi:hypothetical protein